MFYISSSVLKQYILHSTGLVTFQNKRLIATIRHLVQIVFHYLRHSSRGSGIKRVISAFSFPSHFLSRSLLAPNFLAITSPAVCLLSRHRQCFHPLLPPHLKMAMMFTVTVSLHLRLLILCSPGHMFFSFFLGSCVNFNVSQS